MIVKVHDLWKRYGRFDALKGLEFEVPEGSAFALVGPNGAGKTTTIKILVNLLRSRGARSWGSPDRRESWPHRLRLRKTGSAGKTDRRGIPRLLRPFYR